MMVILRGIKDRYEKHHGVGLTEDALQASVKLSRRYIRNRYLPDKAIDIIDEATARIRMQKESKPDEVDRQERLLIQKKAQIEALKDSATTASEKKALAELEAEVAELEPTVNELVGKWTSQKEAFEKLQQTKNAIDEHTQALEQAEADGRRRQGRRDSLPPD